MSGLNQTPMDVEITNENVPPSSSNIQAFPYSSSQPSSAAPPRVGIQAPSSSSSQPSSAAPPRVGIQAPSSSSSQPSSAAPPRVGIQASPSSPVPSLVSTTLIRSLRKLSLSSPSAAKQTCIRLLQSSLNEPNKDDILFDIINDNKIDPQFVSNISDDCTDSSIRNIISLIKDSIQPNETSPLRYKPYDALHTLRKFNLKGHKETKADKEAEDKQRAELQTLIAALVDKMSGPNVRLTIDHFHKKFDYANCLDTLIVCQKLRDELISINVEPPLLFESTPSVKTKVYAAFATNYQRQLENLLRNATEKVDGFSAYYES